MTSFPYIDPDREDRLYALLPAIHRIRDAERGYPLKALLRIITEQANVVEGDIAQLYENLFIETAEDWAVPYIGALTGYRPIPATEGSSSSGGCARDARMVPRREVANLIRNRRRKGTLALLEQLATEIGGWPARAVEQFQLLSRAQNIDHLHLARHRTCDLRATGDLELLDGPFDRIAHGADVRRVSSHRTRGRYNIPSVCVFAFRLRSYSVHDTAAYCAEEAGPHCFMFSVLGQDAPLFVKPKPEPEPTHIAEELNLPVPIRRAALAARTDEVYGEDRSFSIRTEGWAGHKGHDAVPAAQLIAADLSGWHYAPPANRIAVDPALGRIAFPISQLPKKGVRVSYHYGFSASIGGGEYSRPALELPGDTKTYRVGEGEAFPRLTQALQQWQIDRPARAVIELTASGVYVEPLSIELADDQWLQLRAADRVRPVLRLIDWQTDLPDALTVTLGARSRIAFDGLLITGRPIQISSRADAEDAPCGAEVAIRHCTLVPGWAIDCDCEPKRGAEPSLELTNARARVEIEHSILGPIKVHQDEVHTDPIALCISDSIIDATARDRSAIGAPTGRWAHVSLRVVRSTVFGVVDVHAITLGENSIFCGCVNVARRQIGCIRYSYVPSECRTPRRYRCQPDGVIATVKERIADGDKQATEIANERQRVTPQFNADRYGRPAYAQLASTCALEITRGADDESEMGAFHDLFQPQREASLSARLDEYTPASMQVGIVFAS